MGLDSGGPAEIILLGPDRPGGTVAERRTATRERYAGGWLLAKRSPNTREAYKRDIDAFFAWCDEWGFDVFTIRRPHLDGYREYLLSQHADGRAGYSASSVARKLATASSFYTYLVDEEIIQANPARKVERPQVSEGSRGRVPCRLGPLDARAATHHRTHLPAPPTISPRSVAPWPTGQPIAVTVFVTVSNSVLRYDDQPEGSAGQASWSRLRPDSSHVAGQPWPTGVTRPAVVSNPPWTPVFVWVCHKAVAESPLGHAR